MSHIVSNQPWGVIDLDTREGRIFLQQNWFYVWTEMPLASAWTLAERRSFHRATDLMIWGRWSNGIRLKITGTHPFCKQYAASGVPINFDVKWVTRPGHWQVYAHKTPPGTDVGAYHQSVNFSARIINLYTSKLAPYAAGNAAGVSRPNFRSTPHEFGHTLGSPDEYTTASPYLADVASTMNIGDQIRARHLQLVLTTLNTMLPGATFSMQ
jgi:hypothetical protein